ncbi:CAPN15 [Symbiodinium natans]|uniref:CAPN15 protein n=1 Tax=Symbiodinium natans TaxID=878477 RepID=A0A812TU82_9DINO|nr:CAPN15 [Symbiodinium natans]
MDVPQQVCIVLYLLGWYELEGLRCQLCLFHPQHCEPEHPFRLANSAAFLCTLMSSVANQIIIGPSQKGKTSGEPGSECFVRIGLLCVSVLPFTTGVFWATSALLWTPILARILFFLPCVLGAWESWFCVLAPRMQFSSGQYQGMMCDIPGILLWAVGYSVSRVSLAKESMTCESFAPDPTFQGESALGSVQVQDWRKPFKWLRAKELHKDAKLFSVIQADNIVQGELGDCWLLAAMAVFADFPGHIMNLFDDINLKESGRYVIRLWDIKGGGEWQDVEIDDLIPCDKYGKPLFAQLEGESGSMWALLLEKAFAKFVGNYEKLVGGSTGWAWQVLTGQPWMARWTRDEGKKWTRWEMCDIQKCFGKDAENLAAAARWRSDGMRGGRWKGPVETSDDDGMFQALASYTQACFAISCSIGQGDRAEERRPDGLLAKHAYSVLQVLCAHGQRLVQVRNPWGSGGEWNRAWSDKSAEWERHPQISEDLKVVDADDGRFWMPWDAFAEIFGGHIMVCPVTLPCPMNSQIVADKASGSRMRCPQCRQPYTRSWVLLASEESKGDGQWARLADGKNLCFLCLRATCRASERFLKGLKVAGLHEQPKLTLAPPKGPRRMKECEHGAECYRRNPQHFHERFHPSLLPPAPACASGCGRSAASGYKTCCPKCTSSPPDLKVHIPSRHKGLGGIYKAVDRPKGKGPPVWRQCDGKGWLWKGHVWMMGDQEEKVGGASGLIAEDVGDGMSARSPHLARGWQVAGESGWTAAPELKVEVDAKHVSSDHVLCSDDEV